MSHPDPGGGPYGQDYPRSGSSRGRGHRSHDQGQPGCQRATLCGRISVVGLLCLPAELAPGPSDPEAPGARRTWRVCRGDRSARTAGRTGPATSSRCWVQALDSRPWRRPEHGGRRPAACPGTQGSDCAGGRCSQLPPGSPDPRGPGPQRCLRPRRGAGGTGWLGRPQRSLPCKPAS